MDSKQSKMNILMLPFLAHGHITPFLELAKKLSHKNFHIYFCSTPINLKSIKKRITEKYSLSIELVEIHLPSLPELPPHYHTTNGLPIHLNSTLQKAFEMASPNFSNILKTLSPDLVIYDFHPSWAQPIASSYNISAVQLMTSGAMIVSFCHHMIKHPGVEFPFPAIQLQEFHDKRFRHTIEKFSKASKEKQVTAVNNDQPPPCNFELFNTFRELEGKYIDYQSVIGEKRVVPVGPLVQGFVDDENEHSEIIQWLDNKGESSTVFVSFGSEYFMSKEEIEEIAHGLELSNVNFIWVVRFPMGEKVEVEETLPKGFIDRVGERGLVVEGWAPQARILAHSSTGGFVSHCGWNSTLESLFYGVSIVAIPMHLEQPLNAKLVEEFGVAVEVNRDINGRLNREEIAQVIRKVVVEKSGEDIRIKAKNFGEKIRMKGDEEIDKAVEVLLQLCKDSKLLQN
ncbi:hypothetical protein HYC85_000251 [Camellia sinensis]|uniref:Glycosyltransferase N-terminal domain-containing protein n=1 Tax=Camellia sinensis TaxID=4442 RepID=A0A7J7I1X2_CAMSI|nr:hypothetical protein HYC85_000251 [Camellia sinensis]